MKCFVFYINVDQCLNMSNYDMFFYKLESQRCFHLSEVCFAGKNGEVDFKESIDSLDRALYEIRNYIDRNYISRYRIIFGIRLDTVLHCKWTDSVLYRLLWIHYGLQRQRIYTDSRENVEKNVSVIVLHDRDLTLKQPEVNVRYEWTDDLPCFYQSIGVDDSSTDLRDELVKKLSSYLGKNDPDSMDTVTVRFCKELQNVIQSKKEFARECVDLLEQQYRETLEAIKDPGCRSGAGRLPEVSNLLMDQVGDIDVFPKELDKNSMASRLMGFLSIVEYVTLDLDMSSTGLPVQTHQSLRSKGILKWSEIMQTQETALRMKYGIWCNQYKSTLKNALNDLKNNLTSSKKGKKVELMNEESEIEVSNDSALDSKENYRAGFKQIIGKFQKINFGKQTALEDWESAYTDLKEGIGNMELKLELFASDLTRKYYERIKARKAEKAAEQSDKDLYMQEDIEKKEEESGRQKQEILDALNEPQMNPSLGFADQLNLDKSLEECNKKIRFYLKCYRMIHPKNFLILFVSAGGAVLIHHLVMQTNLFSSLSMLRGFTWYFLLAVVLLLLCFSAPAQYFKSKINKCLKKLQEDMDTYISGYFEKADSFKEYINRMNKLDVVSSYMDRLANFRRRSEEYAMRCLWHKKQIEKHLVKISYFQNLADSIPFEQRTNESLCRAELKVDKDVIKNQVYWIQVEYREDSVC